jgi:hypothetical protein
VLQPLLTFLFKSIFQHLNLFIFFIIFLLSLMFSLLFIFYLKISLISKVNIIQIHYFCNHRNIYLIIHFLSIFILLFYIFHQRLIYLINYMMHILILFLHSLLVLSPCFHIIMHILRKSLLHMDDQKLDITKL